MIPAASRRQILALSVAIAGLSFAPARAQARGRSLFSVYEVDSHALMRIQMENIADIGSQALAAGTPPVQPESRELSGDRVAFRFGSSEDVARARGIVAGMPGATQLLVTQTGHTLTIQMTPDAFGELRDHAIAQTIQVMRRRIELAEIERVDDRILLRTAAFETHEQIREIIGIPGQLSFYLVRDDLDQFDDLPESVFVAEPHRTSRGGAEVVDRAPLLSGEHLTRASPTIDEVTREAVLAFQFDSVGAQKFCDITTNHTRQRFAVLLDGRVVTAPTINEPICGGKGQISGSFTIQTVNELAIILRSGALPAPLRLVQEGEEPI